MIRGELLLSSTLLVRDRLRAERATVDKINAVIANPKASADDWRMVAALSETLSGMGETATIWGQIQDRAGLPRMTQLQVAMDKAQPVLIAVNAELSQWDKREDVHELAAGGNGHANSHSQH
ncbi:MAG: hypothetical protein ABIP55_04045 [Tepidisphaeraceae bacterium]